MLFASTINPPEQPHDPGAMTFTEIFRDPCEDQNWESRGWYDGAEASGTLPLAADGAVPTSDNSIQFAFAITATTPTSAGTWRLAFTATDNIYLSYYVKYSSDWVGSGQSYHPHEFHFLTDLASAYSGLADTNLTAYVEQNALLPKLSIQDSLNIDEANIGVNLIPTSESRAVAGCNSGPEFDQDTFGDCYGSGVDHNNGRIWTAPAEDVITVNVWHKIEAFFRMNTISGSVGQADGIARHWLNGKLVINQTDIIFRTNANATMKFDQLIMAPWIGDGSPSAQTFWVDQIVLGTEAGADTTAPSLSTPTAVSTSSTTGSGSVDSANDSNGTLWWVVSTNGTTPSAAQVLAGNDQTPAAGVDSGSQAVTFQGTQPTVIYAGLTASTAYYCHYLHVDLAGNQSSVVSSSSFTTDASADTTAPVLSLPTGVKVNSTRGDGTVSTDEANGTLYGWATTNSTETAANIKTNAIANFDTATVTATGVQPALVFTSLSPATAYFAHFMHEDAATNQSNVVSSSPAFTTDTVGEFDGFFTDGAWSTSFDYGGACTQRGAAGGTNCATINNDHITWSWGNTLIEGNPTEVTAAANNSNGDGGMGFRAWVGDGINIQSGVVRIDFPSAHPELWIRWYQRYQSGFAWANAGIPDYDKTIYLHTGGGPAVLPLHATPSRGFVIASQGSPEHYQADSSPTVKWADIFGTTSDGLFHMFEIHIKMDTNGTSTGTADGIARFWIDGTLRVEETDVNYSGGNATTSLGWTWFEFHSNQKTPANGAAEYVDYDDMAIYRVTPPATDSGGNAWIGPLNGFSGGA